MRSLLLVYHSMTGGTRQMAEAAARGAAQEPAVACRLLRAQDAGPEDVADSDGYLFATPENLASMAGLMKDFFDRCYYPVLDRVNGRPYALMVCAGNAGDGTVRQVQRIVTGWRLREVAEPIIVHTGAQTSEAVLAPKRIAPDILARCEELGAALAAGLAIGVF